MPLIQKYLDKICERENLTDRESEEVFLSIFNGGATPAQTAALLIALRVKGEAADEITGAARVMRAKMIKLPISAELKEKIVDTCGTGGDQKGTYNISTAVALVVASCGVPVAKHGNRSVSSLSGSADVLKQLGVNIELTPEQSAKCLEQVGITFLFAPLYHKAMHHLAHIRKELGVRTIFNILGPLCNPAETKMQLTGVFSPALVPTIAEVAKNLGFKRMAVVHGDDGSDEISVCSKTKVAELNNGEIKNYEINPEDHGFKIHNEEDLLGGDAIHNSFALREALKGVPSAYLDTVILNSAMSLKISGLAKNIDEGIKIAKNFLSSGAPIKTLEKLVEISASFS